MTQSENTAPTTETSPAVVETQPDRTGPEEGQVLGMAYNFSGPVQIVWRDGKQVQEQMPKAVDPDWEQKFLKLKPHHFKAFQIIQTLLVEREQRGIQVPIFMNEMKQITQKQVMKDLEKAGLIEIKLARFQKDGKLAEAVNVLWLSGAGEILAKQIAEQSGQAKKDAE